MNRKVESTVSTFSSRAFRVATDASILTVAFVGGVVLDHIWRQDLRGQAVPPVDAYLLDVLATLPILLVIN